MADITNERVVDPDAQAVVTDFLDYTEYLPSDLIRSLTLIRGLDEAYLTNSYAVHELTTNYGHLPDLPVSARSDALHLRSQISTHLDQALNARESAYAEACRLFDVAERHQNRLKSIIAKLRNLPKPPSRDPTPQPQESPQNKRSRSGRKVENGMSTQKLTLNLSRNNAVVSPILHRPRGRRVTVPGEVLPPFNPDSPIASTEVSDWESPPRSPPKQVLKLKPPKPPKERLPEKPRQPREHVAYHKPTPPPEDAELGTKHKPWTHLTEYEMYKLRKKMKKNHTWEPSEIMIKRELTERGRGWENYYRAKADAQANGSKFNDIVQEKAPVKHEKEKAPTPAAVPATPATPPVVPPPKAKTVKPPEQKRDAVEDRAREKASQAAQEAELAARRLGDIGSAFKNLFTPFSKTLASIGRSNGSPNTNVTSNPGSRQTDKPRRKRKLDDSAASASPSVEPDAQRKRPKMAHRPSITTASEPPSVPTIKVPLKLNVVSPSSNVSDVSTPVSVSQPSMNAPPIQPTPAPPKLESPPPVPSRPPSQRSTAASVEPANVSTRPSRRTSTTPAAPRQKTPALETTPKIVATAASTRSKREAPGTVTQSSQDGGAAVSVSTRKNKPGRQPKAAQANKAAGSTAPVPEIRIDVDGKQEIVDPEEERYCICGDVSWGEMICCELDEKCEFGQWFHMECVKLIELPPRTVKWYCPGDRKKLHKGESSNGLVGRGIK